MTKAYNRFFRDPDFHPHNYEDLHISYLDNINDAYNAGHITLNQWRELYPQAMEMDNAFNAVGFFAPAARFAISFIDNSKGLSNLSKKKLAQSSPSTKP
jgi:hypothetical protein